MTLWLANLLAYSVQLAVLVGAGALLLAVVRVDTPRAVLLFWQAVFAAAIAWPLWQLVTGGEQSQWSATRVLASAAPPMPFDIVSVLRLPYAPSSITMPALIVLAAGVIVRLLQIGIGLRALRAIRAASVPAPSLSTLVDSLQHELGVHADVRFSDDVSGPATMGTVRPVVLLPNRLRSMSPVVQRAVLCHELLHVRRRDWVMTVVEEAWCALLWFHPAARVLASRLLLARETLVDELTVARTGDGRAYAAALLEFATAEPHLPGAAALIRRRHLHHRIALITREAAVRKESPHWSLGVGALVIAVAVLGTSSLLPISTTLAADGTQVHRPQDDPSVTMPEVVREVKPLYTAAAMQAKIEGSLYLLAVVLPNGDVGDVTVRQSLDREHGLDEAAVEAARQWKFKPGTKDGKGVAVEITIEMTFTLR